jgi:hypothetical protein
MSKPLSTLLAGGTGTPEPDRAHRLLVAQRLAEAVDAVHAAGGVIRNLDDHHVLVAPDGTVTLSDDAAAAPESSTRTPAYTAPEIQGAIPGRTRPEAQHDAFALAVLLFQLLMEGYHPYAGQWVGGGDLPEIPKAIQLGLYAYGNSAVTPPPGAPALSALEPGLADLFKRSFAATSAIFRTRPTGAEWARALATVRQDGMANLPPPALAYKSPARLAEPAAAAAGEPASPAAPGVTSGPALTPDPVSIQSEQWPERAPEPVMPVFAPEPRHVAVPETAPGAHPEVVPDTTPPNLPVSPQVTWLPVLPAPPDVAARPAAGTPVSPAKRPFSRRAILKRVIPANDASSTSPVPIRPAQAEPLPWENLASEIGWLVESELRWLTDVRVWGSILAVIFGFLFVVSLLAFVRPGDGATPRARPAVVRATRVPPTQTPQPRPTATRTVVNNPTVASFGSNFDVSDGVIPSTGERFSAYVRDRALRLEVFARGARGKTMLNAAPAKADFSFTVHIGEVAGQGEILMYAREADSGRTWVFAIDPGGNTWGLYEERPSNQPLKVVIARKDYGSAIAQDPLRTITISRNGERTRLLINGVAVNPQFARTMPQISGPLSVGVGAMIPDDPDYADEPFIVTVDRVAMRANEG